MTDNDEGFAKNPGQDSDNSLKIIVTAANSN